MLYSEGVDVNKTGASKDKWIKGKELGLDKGFRFQPTVCNGCLDVLMSIDLNSITISNIYCVDYHCIINGIS